MDNSSASASRRPCPAVGTNDTPDAHARAATARPANPRTREASGRQTRGVLNARTRCVEAASRHRASRHRRSGNRRFGWSPPVTERGTAPARAQRPPPAGSPEDRRRAPARRAGGGFGEWCPWSAPRLAGEYDRNAGAVRPRGRQKSTRAGSTSPDSQLHAQRELGRGMVNQRGQLPRQVKNRPRRSLRQGQQPPSNNHLRVPVQAGIRRWHGRRQQPPPGSPAQSPREHPPRCHHQGWCHASFRHHRHHKPERQRKRQHPRLQALCATRLHQDCLRTAAQSAALGAPRTLCLRSSGSSWSLRRGRFVSALCHAWDRHSMKFSCGGRYFLCVDHRPRPFLGQIYPSG